MPLARGDKWRHTKVSALISILKGSPANAAELISRPRAHNCAFPGGAECEIVSLRSLASLRLLSFFLPPPRVCFSMLPPFLSPRRGLFAPGHLPCVHGRVRIYCMWRCICICLFFFFLLMFFFHLLRSTFSLSISLRRPFHHRGDLQGGGDGAAQQSEESRQALHSGQSKCVWVCERAASNGR